ncbi:MAG TPA: 3-dehydroquinate synthase family protein, partial [Candidatus Binatia bacterium]
MDALTVNLGDRSYPIHVGENNLSQAGALMRRAGLEKKAAIVTDRNVAALYLPAVEASLGAAGFEVAVVLLPAGEEHKNLDSVSAVYDRLVAERFERGSALVALGGGVVGDITGFAAASYLRGVPCVQIPTTLLAQVDSSVGGKTGVNHRAGKNLIGAFHQPRLVLIDVAALRSLPRRELIAGLAEVIKYG